MFWKIQLHLVNGTIVNLNDVRSGNPGWGDLQLSSKIESLRMSFISNNEKYGLILKGMESYNFFVEAMRKVTSNQITINGIWFMGQIPNSNKVIGFVMKQNSVFRLNTNKGNEFNGTLTSGWKKGSVGNELICAINKE